MSAPMKLLHDAPPGFDRVTKAYVMARHLPSTHRLRLRVGVVHGDRLVAEGRLDGYRQAAFLSDHLKDLGYEERLLGAADAMFGCDMVFARAQEDEDTDPSFIRVSPTQLWPVAG
jgi:hypothetical protein